MEFPHPSAKIRQIQTCWSKKLLIVLEVMSFLLIKQLAGVYEIILELIWYG